MAQSIQGQGYIVLMVPLSQRGDGEIVPQGPPYGYALGDTPRTAHCMALFCPNI